MALTRVAFPVMVHLRWRKATWTKGLRATWLPAALGLLVGVFTSSLVPSSGIEPVGVDSSFEEAAALLAEHCVRCHNDQDRQGDFSLQSQAAVMESGFVEAADPTSHLLTVIRGQGDETPAMPKGAEPLSAEEVGVIRAWIEAGAPWPAGATIDPPTRDFHWWSYRPLVRPPVPAGDVSRADQRWVRTPVDAFVLRRLRAAGLTPSPPADRRTLIRRLTYDLTGLPATPEEIDAFLADRRPDAYQRLVDRLLAAPGYGERWGRHYLDVVRYADTCGYDKDKLRAHAWPYRDYVIRSLNEDKPYGRFLCEQIAGDAMFPGEPDGILGLGFIAAGPWDFIGHVEVPETKVDGQVARNLDRDEMVSATLNAFCGITIQCARCHHHKFDPFTQQHYYSLQAIFAAVDRADRPYDAEGNLVYAAATEFAPQGHFQPTDGQPRPIHLLRRGEVTQRDVAVGPGLPPLAPGDDWKLPPGLTESERRAALARWLSDPANPLVWRVMANRVWQYHLGRGIVATPNDFGRMGALPSHPELLDWLASELRDSGGSLKRLQRFIVTSSVYQQSSAHHPANAQIDGDNRYWWRMQRRRLDAEEIRDTALAVSGMLDRQMGGPGFYLFELEKTEHSPHFEYHRFDPADPRSHRRSIYRFVVRSQPDPYMANLDCADSSQSTPRRIETLTSLQALALLNHPFQLEMAARFADRIVMDAEHLEGQITRAVKLVTGREATQRERVALRRYADQHGLVNLCRLLLNLSEAVYLD